MPGSTKPRISKLTYEQRGIIHQHAETSTAHQLVRLTRSDRQAVYDYLRNKKIEFVRIKGSGTYQQSNKN